MSAQTWLIIAIVGFSLAGILLITTVLMFIKMRIPSVIGDLTGKTVAREIKAMREFNESKGDRRFRPSKVNLERGTLTEKVPESTFTPKPKVPVANDKINIKNISVTPSTPSNSGTVGLREMAASSSNATEILSDNATEILDVNATEVLSDNQQDLTGSQPTEILSSNATEILNDNATEVLTENTTILSSNTTVLSENQHPAQSNTAPVPFKITRSQVVIHTEEVV